MLIIPFVRIGLGPARKPQEPLALWVVNAPSQGTTTLKAVSTQTYNLAARRLRLGVLIRPTRFSPTGRRAGLAQEGRWTGNYTNRE